MTKSPITLGVALALSLASSAGMAFQHHGPPPGHGHASPHRAGPPGHRGFHDRGRHEGWYRKGGHVPEEYLRGSYVVTDWRAHRLHEPPRGYEYVRSDNGDYLLVAIATGIIASIIAGQ